MEAPKTIVWDPHSQKQSNALFFETPICLLVSGIQFGKTSVGAMWMKIKNHTYTDKGDNFLVTSPTYKVLNQSTLPPYLKFMEGYGTFSKADMTFKIHSGGTVYFRTGTDPNSVVGITDVRAILCDEFGLYSLYFWENIQARAAFKGAQILGVTSPYATNFLYKEIVRPKLKDPAARPDVTFINARSDESPYFPKDVYERNKSTMDPRRFNMVFGGNFERMAGLVYDCVDEEENQVQMFPFPTATRFFCSVDWGFTEPFVLLVHAILPSGARFQVSETYRTGLTITDIIMICKQKKDVFNVEKFFCDPSQPGYIEELNRNGMSAMGSLNDIRVGLDCVYELLKTRQLKFIRGSSPHTWDELEMYHYPAPEELNPDQEAKEQLPVGQNDHAMDALRYMALMTRHMGTVKKVPKSPDEQLKPKDQFERLRLMKLGKKRHGGGTESWS